ncbi:MAG: type II toxin-antitoxin system HicA family toxin [Proteobacteria bacterium]|nr:type II toxin-antitoxin system HicA family toxin [Pseudomonadota bacterium]MBU1713488.1 type II toxin-antitoxin system HicA family toxin [Pseudomonadota bacterium]
MTKLPIISSKQAIRALRAAGFEDAPRRGKGSHIALVKRGPEKTRLVIVPDSKALPRGTLHAILDQAGIDKHEFIELLKK